MQREEEEEEEEVGRARPFEGTHAGVMHSARSPRGRTGVPGW